MTERPNAEGDGSAVTPGQYRRQVARTTDRILLILLGLSVYSVTANLFYDALKMATTAFVAFCGLLVALLMHRAGRSTPARFVMLTTLNVAVFVGSYFMPQNSNLSLFLLTFIGLPFMVMSWWENRPLMIYFCGLPLVLWTALLITNYGNGVYFELTEDVTRLYGFLHSIMIFAFITLQFFYYDQIARGYAHALRGSLHAQERANEAKTVFLRSMSHEMRTPLGALLGAVDLLRDRADTLPQQGQPSAVELVDIIAQSGTNLLSLTEKSTSFAQITTGDLVPEVQTLSLLSVIGPIMKQFEGQIAQKQIQISVLAKALQDPDSGSGQGGNGTTDLINADPRMLAEALTQVFENALTYTPAGGQVVIRVDPPVDDYLRLCVCDSGPGIPEASREEVFEPYERLGQAYGSQSGGGIGLTIARAYIRAMKGDIGLETSHFGGVRVWVRLPVPAQAAA